MGGRPKDENNARYFNGPGIGLPYTPINILEAEQKKLRERKILDVPKLVTLDDLEGWHPK